MATGRDGREHVAHHAWTAADIARGLSDAELEDKFARLTRDVLPAPRRQGLLELLWRLDEVADVASVVDQLGL